MDDATTEYAEASAIERSFFSVAHSKLTIPPAISVFGGNMSNDPLGDLSNQILTMMSDNTLGFFETRFRRLFRFYPIIHKIVWSVPSVPVAYISDDNGSSPEWASRHPPYCFIFREMTSFTLLPPCLVNKAFGLENVEITVTRVGATNDVVISTKNLSYVGT